MKTIQEMAREAGLLVFQYGTIDGSIKELEAFASLVREDERNKAEDRVVYLFTDMETPYLPDIIKAIRARSNT